MKKILTSFTAISMTSAMLNCYAEGPIVNFQPDSIVVTANLSKNTASRQLWANAYSPSRMPVSEQTGTIAQGIAVGFLTCEPNKKTFQGKILESRSSIVLNSKDRPDTEISGTVTFPDLPSDWVEKQNAYAKDGGCGYYQEPKFVTLSVKGTVPFTNRAPQYSFTDVIEGYKLTIEAKPLDN
jgi:hypothetical protein